MKRYIFVPVIIMMIGACSIAEIDSIVEEKPRENTLIEFVAYIGEEEDTKTEWQPNGEIWWNPEEEICIFYGNSGKNKFTSTNGEKVKKATFTGTLNAFTGETESGDFNYFWAVYPYDAAESCDGSSIVATLANEQIAQVGTFSPNTNLTLAKSAGLSLAFYNVCAWFRFSVAHEGIKAVTFSGNNDEEVAGTFSVTMDGNNRPTTPIVSGGLGQKEIRLTLPNDEAFEVGENYYFTLLPQTFSSGFTLTFETDSSIGSRSVNSSVEFRRNVYHYGNNFDKDVVFVSKNISFADANFKAYCVENFDTDEDGEVSLEEALAVTSIDVCTDNITTLDGIEAFRNLESLSACGSAAKFLSLNGGSGNFSDASLLPDPEPGTSVASGQITGVDLLELTKLKVIDISRNNIITTFLPENCLTLESVTCEYCNILELDVSKNAALSSLVCGCNLSLTTLDISNNSALTRLDCSHNQLTALDVSNNTALTRIYCSFNQLTTLDISNNSALTRLYCNDNQLASLDASNNTALEYLTCSSNQLSSLDLSSNTALTNLSSGYNPLTTLDVSNNVELQNLDCYGNSLSSLDISNNVELRYLNCHSNQLSSLDVSVNVELRSLDCHGNQLLTLDVSNNNRLRWLSCLSNPNLAEIWLRSGQTISTLNYDSNITTIKYKAIPEAVDLGLSVKWASFNLGASTPNGYGDYYAWGETKTKNSFSWSGYKWCNGSSSTLTKYNTNNAYGTVDNKTELDAADDAVHVMFGGNWRLPTSGEWDELISNCTKEYYYNGGTYGWKVTSILNGNSIFLPLPGSKSEWGLNGAGSSGFYWSSTLDPDDSIFATALYINLNVFGKNKNSRCNGVSIRPVTE